MTCAILILFSDHQSCWWYKELVPSMATLIPLNPCHSEDFHTHFGGLFPFDTLPPFSSVPLLSYLLCSTVLISDMMAHWTLGCLNRNRVMATTALLWLIRIQMMRIRGGNELLTHVQTKKATFLPLDGGHLGSKSAQSLAEAVGHVISRECV